MKRRAFAKNLVKWTPVVALSPTLLSAATDSLNILILGGTQFLGPAVVNEAISKGHKVFLFNRGITNPNLFTELPRFYGDRLKGPAAYEPLKDKFWDVIIDTWSGDSKCVEESTRFLRGSTRHYLLVSSISVYRNFSKVDMNEAAETVSLKLDRPKWEYPEHKLDMETKVREVFPMNNTVFRPGPIKGWRDPANDLAYWLVKIKRGETILGPGNGDDPVQFIDVKDLARFMVHTAEEGLHGTYNTTGPLEKEVLTWEELLQTASKKYGRDAEIVWNSTEFLKEHSIEPMRDMPLWLPTTVDPGFTRISSRKAIRSGLRYRPIEKTCKDVLKWFEHENELNFEFGRGTEASPGLARTREQELLQLI